MGNEQWIQERYPHMKKAEAKIWSKFLRETRLHFLNIRYDVHLGKGVKPRPGEPEWMRKLKAAVSRKRCDAIGYTEDEIWIFEVKERVGQAALGQLINYHYLFEEEYHPDRLVNLAAVGARIAPDVRDIYEVQGVELFIMEGEE